jgi:hypothetical protein
MNLFGTLLSSISVALCIVHSTADSNTPKLYALISEATPEAAKEALASSRHSSSVANLLYSNDNPAFSVPQQIHLAPGPSPLSSMRVTWVAYDRSGIDSSFVNYWPCANSSAPHSYAKAKAITYSAGIGGWNPNGTIYSAVMINLTSGVEYSYIVGSLSAQSTERSFSLPPSPSATSNLRMALIADMGTIVPLGWAVADRLAEDHLISGRYDAIAISGDLSYATVSPGSCSIKNPSCDEVEWTWDSFGLQIEAFASTTTFIPIVGNHEHVPGNITTFGSNTTTTDYEFASFSARYTDTPFGGATPFWYSIDLGPVHFVALSSEHPFSPGSPQLAWLDADLSSVDRSITPWVVTSLHRPILSAAVLEWEDHSPGAKLSAAFEPIFKKHAVDVCIAGHIHSWEYTYPVFNGTVESYPAPGNSTTPTFVSPTAPIYVVQGTSGALPENVFFDPPPVWSANRLLGNFGYGRITVTGGQRFLWEFVGMYGEILDSWAINKSTAVSPVVSPSTSSPITVSILSYGGVGDGTTDNTKAFVDAVSAITAAGGGTLFIPTGKFLTGPFNLTNDMTLLLGDGSSILGGTDYKTWPLVPPLPSFMDGNRYHPLIFGVELVNVKILSNSSTGMPTIDGQGLSWMAANAAKQLKGQRPHAIELYNCTNVEIAGVSVVQSAFWSVHPVYSQNVYIHNMEVTNTVSNGDGIDPDGCNGVIIDRVVLTTGDDAIAIKSGTRGLSFPPTNNITIRNSRLTSGEACVAIGSEMTAGVSNVEIGPNVSCASSGHGLLYIKETRTGGGYVSDITVHDATVSGFLGKFLWLSQSFGENGEKIERSGDIISASSYPIMKNIAIRDINALPGTIIAEVALVHGDLVSPDTSGAGFISNVTLERIHLSGTILGWTCANISGTWVDVSPTPCSQFIPQ